MNRVLLIMFGADEVVYPKESEFFQEHDLDGNIVPYEDTELYKNDTIGLKTMQEAGKIDRLVLDGGSHIQINRECEEKYFIPFLYGDLDHSDDVVHVDCLKDSFTLQDTEGWVMDF